MINKQQVYDIIDKYLSNIDGAIEYGVIRHALSQIKYRIEQLEDDSKLEERLSRLERHTHNSHYRYFDENIGTQTSIPVYHEGE